MAKKNKTKEISVKIGTHTQKADISHWLTTELRFPHPEGKEGATKNWQIEETGENTLKIFAPCGDAVEEKMEIIVGVAQFIVDNYKNGDRD